jgi:hypothetical protein
MLHRRPYGVAQALGSVVERSGKIFICCLPLPGSSYPQRGTLFGPFFLRDDYLFPIDWQGHPTGLRQPALLYIDQRDALRTGQHNWRKINYPKDSIAITQAFSIEEDDLVVSVLR